MSAHALPELAAATQTAVTSRGWQAQGSTMKVNLVVVRGKPQGKTLGFPCGEFVFGRGDECHVRPNSSWVSRQHCMLCVTEDAVQLRDLGSTNGTLINGKRLMGERMLADGDQIQVGPLVFQVRLEPGLAETGNFNLDTDVVPIFSADQEQTVTAPNIADDARTSQT